CPSVGCTWRTVPTVTLSAPDILQILNEGKAYLNVETGAFPDGEISGHFTQANGTPTFTPPPAPPIWPDDHANSNAASLFLIQSTFGPSPADIATVQSIGYTNWLLNQFALPASHHLPLVMSKVYLDP